jgi:hypothetical protein
MNRVAIGRVVLTRREHINRTGADGQGPDERCCANRTKFGMLRNFSDIQDVKVRRTCSISQGTSEPEGGHFEAG